MSIDATPTAAPAQKTRTWTNPEGVVFTASLMYTDALGHEWYGFEEPLRMPTQRGLEGELAAEWANLNITPDDMEAYENKMREQGNSGDIVGLFSTLDKLGERRKWACERKTLYAMADVYFMIDDEPLEAPTTKHGLLKREVWASDSRCAAFFLQRAFVLTKGYSALSRTDIHTYLLALELLHLRTPSEKQPSDARPTGGPPSRTSFMIGVKALTRRHSSSAKKSPPKSTS